jgi:hypothetical protein
MTYTKPQITLFSSAIAAVQSSTSDKSRPQTPDSSITSGTSSAYEADE